MSPFSRPSASKEGGIKPTFKYLLTGHKMASVPEIYSEVSFTGEHSDAHEESLID